MTTLNTSGIASPGTSLTCPVAGLMHTVDVERYAGLRSLGHDGRSRRCLSAGAPISAYGMIPVSMPEMVTLGADIPASHPARAGINAGKRLSDFRL